MTEKEKIAASSTTDLTKKTDTDETSGEVVEPDEKQRPSGDIEDSEKRHGLKPNGQRERRQLSISLRSLLVGAIVIALASALGALTWLHVSDERKLTAEASRRDDLAHAEKLALDYATSAAAMNYQDLAGWKVKLVAGTSPELKDRLSKAAEQMEQILVPLQWNSTAQPLAAKVRSVTGSAFDVDSFVSVQTKTVQSPDPLQSTATYRVTIDKSKNWLITDVGGIGAATGGK